MPVRVSSLPPRTPNTLPAVLPAPPHTPTTRVRVTADRRSGRPPLARRWVLLAAGLVVVLHVAANLASPYGVHRDELLYLAMGEHLRLWAMDFPPFIAILAQVTRAFGGADGVVDGTAVLRLGPALAHGVLVVLAAVLARELGGRRGAQLLAALCVGASPLFLRSGSLFQPVVFDQLWWTLGFAALVRAGRTRGRRRRDARTFWLGWMLLGAAVGFGLLTKFSVAFFAAGAAAGVLATPLRRALRTPAPWAAAALALVLGAPSVAGQVRLGWPAAAQMADLRASQLARVGPAEFAAGQLPLGPALALALLGLAVLLGAGPWLARRRPAWLRVDAPAVSDGARAAGVAALVAVLLLVVGRGKPYYAGPVYPLLWAAGAVALLGGSRAAAPWPHSRWARWRIGTRPRLLVAGGLVALYGLVTLPFGLPVLPPAAMARYAAVMGGGTTTNTGERLALPQDYADMLGWPAQARAAAAAFGALSPEERAEAAVVGGNYGQAGALALYGPRLGLPPAVSPAGSFWFFGPGSREGRVAVVVADSAEAAPALARLYADVRAAGPAVAGAERAWVVPEERRAWVFVARGGRAALRDAWAGLKGRQ